MCGIYTGLYAIITTCPQYTCTHILYVFYFSQFPAHHRVMKLVCLNKNNGCTIHYSGKEHFISFLSKKTACAHELGYDFRFHRLKLKGDYATFCLLMNRQYAQFVNGSRFLTAGTFEKWFTSWSST